MGKDSKAGNLIGFVYGIDRITPVEGAVLMLRSVSTGVVYESTESDKLGVVKVEGIDEGLYIVGVSTKEMDYNLEGLIGIRAHRTSKVALLLEEGIQEADTTTSDKKCPRGEWYVPETPDVCDEGYRWNAEKNRCECKKEDGFFAFFVKSTGGIAISAAAALGAILGVVSLSDEKIESSEFR